MDKEFALIIAEMLIKQDETTAQIKEVVIHIDKIADHIDEVVNHIDKIADKVNEVTTQVNNVSGNIQETNSILREFMAISVKQWDQQQIFNEVIISQLKEIKETLSTLAQLDTRLKALEERESKFESRLANIERLMKAS